MTMPSVANTYDVLIIGSGAAGLSLALHLLPSGASIAVMSKDALHEGSTFYAQGGIAAVLDGMDSTEAHIQDTLVAGGDLCHEDAVRFVVENAADAIARLDDLGVGFSRDGEGAETEYHLTREGGHSHRRVVHVQDATGQAVESTLVARIREHPAVTLLENHTAVDLIRDTEADTPRRRQRVTGAYALDQAQGRVIAIAAKVVVLATGGASKVYRFTSNPDISTGDGIAMAWRAGCRVANMEFTQFHPTCLFHPEAKSFLITEAVRGEGGVLRLPNGERFMLRFDARAELAPRDVVARAIDHEMKRLGIDHVYLDITHKGAAFITSHFPKVHGRCLELGLDMTKDALPVVPAAHYSCGGVMTDLCGRTDVDGLYAIGETTHIGLHGANRLASNSLLECLVIAKSAAQAICDRLPEIPPPPTVPPWDESWVTDSDEAVVVQHNWAELRSFMWDYVGIVRSHKRLQRAKRRIDLLSHEIDEYYGNFRVTADLLELRNLVLVAKLIVRSALRRLESRGLHYTLDHPQRDSVGAPQDTVLVPKNAKP